MVKDHDAPYLSIAGCVVAVSADNPDEYIGAVALLSMMGIEYGRESLFLWWFTCWDGGWEVEDEEYDDLLFQSKSQW